jgi:hypothetical protein
LLGSGHKKQTFGDGFPPYGKPLGFSVCTANLREPKQVNRLRLAFACLVAIYGCKSTKFDQTAIPWLEIETEACHARLHFAQKPVNIKGTYAVFHSVGFLVPLPHSIQIGSLIHPATKSNRNPISSPQSALPFSIRCHFYRSRFHAVQ